MSSFCTLLLIVLFCVLFFFALLLLQPSKTQKKKESRQNEKDPSIFVVNSFTLNGAQEEKREGEKY